MLIVDMKIQLEKNNKIFVFQGSEKKELHPIWLRERVSEKEYLDANTEQRLFDPSFLKDITIKEVKIDNNLLNLEFSDGVKSKFDIKRIEKEFSSDKELKKLMQPTLWNGSTIPWALYETQPSHPVCIPKTHESWNVTLTLQSSNCSRRGLPTMAKRR